MGKERLNLQTGIAPGICYTGSNNEAVISEIAVIVNLNTDRGLGTINYHGYTPHLLQGKLKDLEDKIMTLLEEYFVPADINFRMHDSSGYTAVETEYFERLEDLDDY